MKLIIMINKILKYKTYTIRRKIDALLELNANIYCNLGTDSSKAEIAEGKKQSTIIFKAIRTLDKNTGDRFLHTQDK
tara:strand:+ start:1889 stop:2119 length:231 start_codon:yes stop_codon:yes gene_type:complete